MNSLEKTYWNGEPCEAQRVTVLVAAAATRISEFEQERRAVEVSYRGRTFYIDDEGFIDVRGAQVGFPGWGWSKVTTGYGSSRFGYVRLHIVPGSAKPL